MIRSLRTTGLPFLAFSLLLLLLSCSSQEGDKEAQKERGESILSHEQQPGPFHGKIIYRLKWLYNASTLGDLWALKKGIFKRYGLLVEIREGGAETDAIKEIELGRAMFGVASADQVLRAVSKGADVAVVAQFFQKNPFQWIYIKERTGFDPDHPAKSLKKVTVAITYGGNDETIFKALVHKLGLSPEDLHIYAKTQDYSPFWKNRVQLWPVYINTQGVMLQEKILASGQTPGFLDPERYGIRFVANSLITSSDIVKKYPETVARFRAAVLEGWLQALKAGNRQEAASMLMEIEPGLSERTALQQIDLTARLVLPAGKPIGTIDKAGWQKTLKIMGDQKLLKEGAEGQIDLSAILIDSRTL